MAPHIQDLDLTMFDGLEVSACIEVRATKEDEGYTERLEASDDLSQASFWTVYGHRKSGGAEALWDFPSFDSAKSWALELLVHFPDLQKHGIYFYNTEV